ncbi:MAG: TldD/PmbA family protein [Pseudanabaenaceae cyanobacterium bins.68]|nr:TldD/PmbA family protein [Pseudanabaenaceae cyanobacterium bins.68]
MEFDLEQALAGIDLPVDWLGLRLVEERQQVSGVRDRLPQVNSRNFTQGIMVEAMVDGAMGYSSTNDLSALGEAAHQAYAQAIAARNLGLFRHLPSDRPRAVGTFEQPQGDFDFGTVTELLQQICSKLQVSDRIVQTRAAVQTTETFSWLVSSNGTNLRQRWQTIATDFAATAQDGNIIQTRSDHGQFARCYQGGLDLFLGADLWQRVTQVGEQAEELLFAAECPDLTTDLLLAPDQMLLQIHESVGHPLELDRILGDERNYAGSSFVQLQDFGQLQYGAASMNVTFDPDVPGEFASYEFDDLGMPAQRQYLIKDGKLLRGLGSLDSQRRSGVPGTASARACSWNRPAIDRMANLNLEPGTQTLTELISAIEHGVYMQSNRSWSIDDYRLKFQFGCEYAQLIEHGKITKTLRNPNYRGITPQFWHSLKGLGDRHTLGMFGSPFCGKGEPNQTIRVGHRSPVCLFHQVEVFGGG